MSRFFLAIALLALIIPCAASAGSLRGVDVSSWQGSVSWSSARQDSGFNYAYLKSSEGSDYTDPTYAPNRAGTNSIGVISGAYHFARPSGATAKLRFEDAQKEADHFIAAANPQPGDLIPALDLETSGGLTPGQLIDWTAAFLQEVEAKIGVKPIIYTFPSFWQSSMNDTQRFSNEGYKLWISHFHVASPIVPAGNWGGKGYVIWQPDDCLKIRAMSGCVDGDITGNSSLNDLRLGTSISLLQPLVVGETLRDATLSVELNGWGDPTSQNLYSWQLCKQGECKEVGTDPIYTVKASDEGGSIRAVITLQNDHSKSITTPGTTPIDDVTPPTTAPVLTGGLGALSFGAITTSWLAHDTGSGVATYALRYRHAPLGQALSSYTYLAPGDTVVSHPYSGESYCFSALAIDGSGNKSLWSAESCTSTPLDDSSFAHAGRWAHKASGSIYGGGFIRGKRHSMLSVHVEGTRFYLLTRYCRACGVVEATLNGRHMATLNLHASHDSSMQTVSIGSYASTVGGTLRIHVLRGKGDIDGVAVASFVPHTTQAMVRQMRLAHEKSAKSANLLRVKAIMNAFNISGLSSLAKN